MNKHFFLCPSLPLISLKHGLLAAGPQREIEVVTIRQPTDVLGRLLEEVLALGQRCLALILCIIYGQLAMLICRADGQIRLLLTVVGNRRPERSTTQAYSARSDTADDVQYPSLRITSYSIIEQPPKKHSRV